MTFPCRDVDNSGSLDQLCDSGALVPILSVLSHGRPQDAIAFVKLVITPGSQRAWADHVTTQVALLEQELARTALTSTRSRRRMPYVAAAHVVGARSCNALLEVMAEDEDTLLRLVLELTDVVGVADVQVLRCAPGDTRGFGEPGRSRG
jgi:hypothetical protein